MSAAVVLPPSLASLLEKDGVRLEGVGMDNEALLKSLDGKRTRSAGGVVHHVEVEEKIVSFVDLLGTKNLMQSVEKKDQAQETFDLFQDVRVKFQECFNSVRASCRDAQSIVISDSYVIAVPNEKDAFRSLVLAVSSFQKMCLLNHSQLVRGGIAVGNMVGGDNDNAMIGKAFVDAHLLEEHLASYPRVVLSRGFPNLLKNLPIAHDKDGIDYISFLYDSTKEELRKVEKIAITNIKSFDKKKLPHEAQKWEWLKTYVEQVRCKRFCCCYESREN